MQSKEFEIIIDMDGVLADMTTHFCHLVKKYHKVDLKPEHITNYSIHENHPDLTPKIYRFFEQPGFFRHLEPIPGAIEALESLLDRDFNVSIVTSCLTGGHDDKRNWLKDHLQKGFYEKIIKKINFSNEKERFQGHVFIDDSPDNLEKYVRRHPKSLILCFDQPYNRQCFAGIRVCDWDQAYNLIDKRFKSQLPM